MFWFRNEETNFNKGLITRDLSTTKTSSEGNGKTAQG